MNISLKIILGILLFIPTLYVYISVFIFCYAIYVKRDLDEKPILEIKFLNNYFFFIGCLIGLTAFFAAGFERALFFIPENWGGINEDGNWTSTKEYFSYILAFISTIGLLGNLDKISSKK